MKRSPAIKDVEQFANMLESEEKARATIDKYVHDAMTFCLFVGRKRIDKSVVMDFKNMLMKEHTPRSVNSTLAAVNRFLSFVGLDTLRVKRIPIQRQIFCERERELNKDEYERLVETAQKLGKKRLGLILQTLCSTGIRIGELRHITVKTVRDGRAIVTSKGKTRVIMLPRKLCVRLLRYCTEGGISEGVVFRTKSGLPVDRSNVWTEMKRLCEAANVPKEKTFPHNLRHLFARMFYEIEKDISRLADVLGHTSIDTTRIYIISSGLEHTRLLERMRLVT